MRPGGLVQRWKERRHGTLVPMAGAAVTGVAVTSPANPQGMRPWVGRMTVQPLRPTTTPGRLRLLLAGLVALCLVWGAVAAWVVIQRSSAASDVAGTSEPLSLDGQQIYQSLSGADATAATAFLSGGLEPLTVRLKYQADIAQAASRLESATTAAGHSAVRTDLVTLSTDLPVYTGEVETARADNRLGLPLGAAYLREASSLMRGTLLPAARQVSLQANARLDASDGQATGLPSAAVALVAAIIAGYLLYRAHRWLARRTHRIVNYGLLVTSVTGIVSLLWLITALTVARADLLQARNQGSAPVEALAQADITALQAHADESLTLIDNGGDDSFQADFIAVQRRLGPGPGTLLTTAAATASGSPGAASAAAAGTAATAWYAAHAKLRSLDDSGMHGQAVQSATGSGPADSGTRFGNLDSALTSAIAEDQAAFESHAAAGMDATTGLEAGVIVLSLIMAAGCAWGITRRLAEYR